MQTAVTSIQMVYTTMAKAWGTMPLQNSGLDMTCHERSFWDTTNIYVFCMELCRRWHLNPHYSLDIKMGRNNSRKVLVIVDFLQGQGVKKFWTPDHLANYILCGGTWYLWVFSMELASCHLSCTYNFELASRFLENMCIRLTRRCPQGKQMYSTTRHGAGITSKPMDTGGLIENKVSQL
jgi:hypothetical protein